MSKGDRYRYVDPIRFAKGYDAVFNKCSEHPMYRVLHPPYDDCIVCRRLWREARLKDTT